MPGVEGTSTSAPALPSAADLFPWLEKSRKAKRQEPQLQLFSTERVRNWFTVAEKQFESAQVDNQHDMFNLVCAAVDPATTDKVMDVIETLPMEDRYKIFKAALIDRFAPSSRQQKRKLLQGVKLDNRSPSELLRHMRKLAGKDADSQLVLELWTTALPSNIQDMLIVCCDEQTGEAQARVADRLYARHREDEPNIAPISISSDMGRRDDQYETSPS